MRSEDKRTSLGLFNRMPYSNWFSVETLRSYLHELELEQLRADYNALSMYRFRSPSNSGVIYWSFTKGGPLFQFGCVDYGGYPMMPYYAVKRVFAPIAVHAYRDISDIVVMFSNHTAETVEVRVEAYHVGKQGIRLNQWTWDIQSKSGDLLRVQRLEDLYSKVQNRTEEAFYVCAVQDGCIVSDDLLFFCPFSEYESEYQDLKVKIAASGPHVWQVHLGTETPARLIELESNHKLLYSDDYFPLIPGKDKTITVSLLEKTNEDPVRLTVHILGSPQKQTYTL
jgi:beta-mannosidase